MRKKICSFING
ncbi:hypothetical protein LINGRAHAP2_LOCUS3179 [Linum grandiflorum]